MAKKTESKDVYIPHSPIQTDEIGTSHYSEVNLTHHAASQAAMPLVLKALQSIVIKSGSVFTIVDYGTADGGVSMPLIYACVKAIREKYGEELPINVIYEDQPTNDFKSLFMRVHGLIPGSQNFFLDFANVFVLANGTNFYSQCFPTKSVTFGISTSAMHWLRDKPCDITGALFHKWSTVPEEKEKFRKKAEKDWELILLNRAAELIPGGKMILVQVCDKQNDSPKCYGMQLLDLFWNILKSLADEGVVTKEELKSTNFNFTIRTIEEIKKPFQSKDSPVNKAGLELVSLETHAISCRFREKWMKEKGDAKEHAKQFVASLRTWSKSTFLSGLSDARSAEEKANIVDEVYRRCEVEVAKQPKNHGLDLVHAFVVVQKRLEMKTL